QFMSVEHTGFVWRLTKDQVTQVEKMVLLSMADRAGENGEAWPSIKRLELDTLLNRKTIMKSIDSLIKKGLIARTGRHVGRSNQVPVYIFSSQNLREE